MGNCTDHNTQYALSDSVQGIVCVVDSAQRLPYYTVLYSKSKIRHKDFFPPVTLRVPPWILKRGELESSGQKIISSIGKIKRIALFFSFVFWQKKNNKKIVEILPAFSRFFWGDWAELESSGRIA